MVDISTFMDAGKTMAAVDAAMVTAQQARFRPYLGMSAIGGSCERRLWYEFRWAMKPSFNARTLRLFEDGHASEDIMARRLRMVDGIKLHTIDRGTGQQFEFTDIGGHFKGHMDGAILGILEAPKTWHVWEHKCSGEKVQARLKKAIHEHGEKGALQEWNYTYYVQAVHYLHYTKMTRHYLTCSTPGTRDTVTVRTEANPKLATKMIERARRIIFAPEPPPRVSDSPSWWECKFCPLFDLCHGTAMPEVNMRTCLHARPTEDGEWYCTACKKVVPPQEQSRPCEHHLLIPGLLEHWSKPTDTDGETWVKYENGVINHVQGGAAGENCYTSQEIVAAPNSLPLGEAGEALRAAFPGARVVGEEQA